MPQRCALLPTSQLPKVLQTWFAPQRRALFQHRNFQKWSERHLFCTCWLRNVLRATTACTFADISASKSVPNLVCVCVCVFAHVLASKCASRHNGVHFFDISTSKSGPSMVCFAHFDFEMCFAPQWRALLPTSQLPKVFQTWCVFAHVGFKMCFAPQRRALFQHRNFQKWSERHLFCTCWLRNVLRATTACTFADISASKSVPNLVCVCTCWLQNVLRATTACTFSTSQLPKVVRTSFVLYMLASKCASRHNGMHFCRHLNFQKWSEHGVLCAF